MSSNLEVLKRTTRVFMKGWLVHATELNREKSFFCCVCVLDRVNFFLFSTRLLSRLPTRKPVAIPTPFPTQTIRRRSTSGTITGEVGEQTRGGSRNSWPTSTRPESSDDRGRFFRPTPIFSISHKATKMLRNATKIYYLNPIALFAIIKCS